MNTKSKVFMASVIMCFVLSAAVLIIARAYLRNIGEARQSVALRTYAGRLHNSTFSVDDKANRLTASADEIFFRLTIDAELQKIAEDMLKMYNPVKASFILMDATTGEIIVMAAYSRKRDQLPMAGELKTFLDPIHRSAAHPMASLAKIITAAAAIEKKNYGPGDTFDCSGRYRIEGKGSVSDPKGVAHGNITMGRALAASCNPVYGRIAVEVGRDSMAEYFDRFAFNSIIPFDLPLEESVASVGHDDYRVARVGAGFDGAWMSPVHAAAIAGSVRNGGRMMKPWFIRSIERDGKRIYQYRKQTIASPIEAGTARTLGLMMSGTVNGPGGTAYRGFYKNGDSLTGSIRFAGKTGSLSGDVPQIHYAWFIGHVEKGARPLAFSSLVVNDGTWKIKAASFAGQYFKAVADDIK